MNNTKYMSLKVFTFMVNTIKELLDNSSKFNNDMTKVLGGDSQVISEINHKTIENIEMFLTEHFNDIENRWVEYLVWEVISRVSTSSNQLIIQVDGVDYDANTENIYKIITNQL
jgi:hypothetical protein